VADFLFTPHGLNMSAFDVTDRRNALKRRAGMQDVLAFFGLTFLVTTPFWAAGAATGVQLLPGLPVAALAVICPGMAAFGLSWRLGGVIGCRALLMRAFDFGRITAKRWWFPILLISPAVSVASFLILRLSGSGVPDPQITVLPVAALFAVFLVSALSEELGWSGFALDPLQARLGMIPAALAIGAVWAVWHVPALLQAHRSAAWIAWWALGTVATRLVLVWLFNHTGGSVFGVSVFHAVGNLCWQLFPVHGSWFDPRLNGLLMGGIALAVVLATLRRGAATLTVDDHTT
jgi:membrane protease YdiL (CAAX protease family)